MLTRTNSTVNCKNFPAVTSDHILKAGADCYNKRRSHSDRDHLPPTRDEGEPPVIELAKRQLVCRSELGGQLNSYRAVA